ncbi:G-type lectin S-receptor-like serine/threonine-protein kinase At4g27290 [Coffea arabica]|uniref:Receptor-like serine/threonine-protein kinase n=1 Tax=Coffea arabica TaxID=13443 RepID=A0A6P6S5K1_COFAR|nr:G-type lectin S-receptor-like serine/threonine-protein kinase At4g27290 [Coffea arabica]
MSHKQKGYVMFFQFPPRIKLRRESERFPFLFFSFILVLCRSHVCNAVDTITTIEPLRDGETITSSGGNFELGFFSPGNSSSRYVGIRYNNISSTTVVWVANRGAPLTNASGILKVAKSGQLILLDYANNIIWSTNLSRPVQNPFAQLLDSGNFILKDSDDENSDNFLWQSFDHPTDTLLPGMKLGWNLETGQEFYLTSWKNENDPAPGEFTYRTDITGYAEHVLRKGPIVISRGLPWTGIETVDYSGAPNTGKNPVYSFALVYNQRELYFSYQLLNSFASRFVLNQSGVAQNWLLFDDEREGWVLHFNIPNNTCDSYGLCGPYGACNIANDPICGCLEGFQPKYPHRWVKKDWSGGCIRRTPLNCENGDENGFLKYSVFTFPETKNTWYSGDMALEDCKTLCLKNCSCTAYANPDARDGGSGCLLWFEQLIDIRENSQGQDVYIRLASTELVSRNGFSWRTRVTRIVGVSLSSGVLLLGLSLTLYRKRKKKLEDYEDEELVLFDLDTLIQATSNFSPSNKLGEGGFGPVYKGVLEDGQEIAVKRLSKTSTQGLDEFKNEVIYITKLQHRNLVKMLGCCIQGEEKMLIYEFMHNRSLDSFIFDPARSRLLDWPQRFNIINGIARGLLYLHEDSRLRIIHRDLKASNILLDDTMNPKISDFGTARSFIGNETGARTDRVAGTYGYMSPEYAMQGRFSVKSDVFSFGVTILEIVSGQKNNAFVHPGHHHSLLGHAWKLYKEGRSLELVDESLGNYSTGLTDVLRSIHVGLLCVQQYPEDRPNMSAVVMMLGNEGALPQAHQPGFFAERNESCSAACVASSQNDMTITILEPR